MTDYNAIRVTEQEEEEFKNLTKRADQIDPPKKSPMPEISSTVLNLVKMVPVESESGTITEIGYDPVSTWTVARFKNGQRYAYGSVPQALAEEFVATAGSKETSTGKFFNQNIRQFPTFKVIEQAEVPQMKDASALTRLRSAINREVFLSSHGFKFLMIDGEMLWAFDKDRSVKMTGEYVESADDLEWEIKEDFVRVFAAAFENQSMPEHRDRIALIKWAEHLRTLPEPVLETITASGAVQLAMFGVCLAGDMVRERADLLAGVSKTKVIVSGEEALPC